MSLTHWFQSQHSDVVAGWIHANPSYKDTDENAALIFSRLGDSPLTSDALPDALDAAWKQLQAGPVSREIDNDPHGLEKNRAWTLAQALWARVDKCPFPGARAQMKNALAQLLTAGGAWFIAEGKYRTPIAEPERSA